MEKSASSSSIGNSEHLFLNYFVVGKNRRPDDLCFSAVQIEFNLIRMIHHNYLSLSLSCRQSDFRTPFFFKIAHHLKNAGDGDDVEESGDDNEIGNQLALHSQRTSKPLDLLLPFD